MITAIDEAIAAKLTGPGSISAMGQTVTYRSFDELLKLRQYYAGLQAGTRTIRQSIKMGKIISGGMG